MDLYKTEKKSMDTEGIPPGPVVDLVEAQRIAKSKTLFERAKFELAIVIPGKSGLKLIPIVDGSKITPKSVVSMQSRGQRGYFWVNVDPA